MKEQTKQLHAVSSRQGRIDAQGTCGDIVQHLVGIFSRSYPLIEIGPDQIHEAHEQTRQENHFEKPLRFHDFCCLKIKLFVKGQQRHFNFTVKSHSNTSKMQAKPVGDHALVAICMAEVCRRAGFLEHAGLIQRDLQFLSESIESKTGVL